MFVFCVSAFWHRFGATYTLFAKRGAFREIRRHSTVPGALNKKNYKMLSPLQLGAQHVEDVLSSVSEQTARLAAAVSNVSAALEQRATRDDVRAAGEAQRGQVAALAQRLAALERAVTVRESAFLCDFFGFFCFFLGFFVHVLSYAWYTLRSFLPQKSSTGSPFPPRSC